MRPLGVCEVMLSWSMVAIAVLAGAAKGYCGKKTSSVAEHVHDAVYISAVRFGLCALLGGLIALMQSGLGAFAKVEGIWLTVIAGLAQAMFTTTWLLAVRTGAYVMLDAFLTAGILIPTLLCRFLFNEAILPLQWLGFAILLCAVLVMCSYNNSIKKKLNLKSIGLLLLCAVSSGIVDFTQKALNYQYPQTPVAAFQFYTYVFAMLILAAVVLFVKPAGQKPVSIKNFGWPLVIMAICLFINTYCKQLAAAKISAVALYSACQGGGLILSVLMSAVCFREPVKKRSIIGIILIFAGMLLITFVG